MSGLRHWERDADLLEPAGDGGLAPPTTDEVAELVAQHLSAGARPERVRWIYARWKPRVALACAYELEFAGGGRAVVVLKRRRDGKSAGLVERLAGRPSTTCGDVSLRAAAWAPGVGALWTPVGDPRLPGIALCEDRRALRRVVDAHGLCDGGVMRRRASGLDVLRYRPERRAVLKFDLAVRRPDGSHDRRGLALRCLGPAQAARVAANRRAFGPTSRLPALVGHDERRGVLLETWLDVDVPAPDEFGHVTQAAELLAWLHGHPAPEDRGPVRARGRADDRATLVSLLGWHPGLRAALDGLPAQSVAPIPPTWSHGDLHPDQVARGRADGRAVLLDLDELRPGDPDADLASWIADRLAEQGECSYAEAATPLLDAYSRAGGRRPGAARVRAHVRAALVSRAAAACRRLERDAARRAGELLRRAHDLGDARATEAPAP